MRGALVATLGGPLGESLSAAQLDRLVEYGRLVQRYGQRLNLVGDRSDAFVGGTLIGGSLQLLRIADPRGRLVDIGSGAGAPGIPLALARPDLAVRLVEVRGKRVAFLRRAIQLLAIPNVDVWEGDATTLLERFDWAVARAFRPPSEWLRVAVGLVDPGGGVGVYTTHTAWAETVVPDELEVLEQGADPTGKDRWLVTLQRSTP